MSATTVEREARDLELCRQHLGEPAPVVQDVGCVQPGCRRHAQWVRPGLDDDEATVCTRDAARRLRRLMTLPRPSVRQRAACRLARLSTRQFLELSSEATAYWFRKANAIESLWGAR